MDFSRRRFLAVFSAGIVGACVVTKVPTALLPASVQYNAACEFLRRHWAAHARHFHKPPAAMRVGRAVFEQFESEILITQRFASHEGSPYYQQSVLFKGTPLLLEGEGWGVTCTTS